MHIHEIIIDGFKSYAQRTVVSGFDPQFNAITGLNGTGKSNILDSICFVLGINNLSQVRVGNLQELVYKQGQAGVTKASVTIVFNNSDPSTSPIGYETSKQITVTRQVVIGGKNKYMINGRTVQQSEVQNLFHSVQLNVNNPHFLIMQGRITKVLNMKPVEILSMIEEAAGTRMFETKKVAALKTIEKKQQKVQEITKCMDDEIMPTLDKLRGEKQNYQTFQQNGAELERLERFCVAVDYRDLEKAVDASGEETKQVENAIDEKTREQEQKVKEVEDAEAKIAEIQAEMENEMEADFQLLKKTSDDLSKELVKLSTHANNHKENLQGEKDTAASLVKQVEVATQELAKKKTDLAACLEEVKAKDAEASAAEQAAAGAREKYQNAVAGVVDGETSADVLSLPEQVATWEKRAREAQSQLQQGTLKADHAKKKLKELRAVVKTQQSANSKTITEVEGLKRAIAAAEERFRGLNFNEAEEMSLRTQAAELESATSTLRDEVERLTVQLQSKLNFDYKDPERGFDRSKVKGLVARLVRVNDPKTATALEISAAGRLYQVVVDTEQTGKLLLQKGGLRSRVTILPLNKVVARCTDPAKVDCAKQIAAAKGGSAHLALELVGFHEEVRKAMEYTFGNAIICDSAEIAKEVAFDKRIRNRTVTLEGDVFDPSGTLTGGANKQLGSLLGRIEELATRQDVLDKKKAELKIVQKNLQQMEAQCASARDIENELELKRHALKICEEKIAESSYAQTMTEIEAFEKQLVDFENESVSLKETQEKATQELKQLQDAEKNIKKQREKAMKDLENQMKTAQKSAQAVREQLAKLQGRRETLAAEVESLTRNVASLQEQLTIASDTVDRLSAEADKYNKKVADCRKKYDEAEAALSAKKQELSERSKEIKALNVQKEKTTKAATALSVEVKKFTHKLDEMKKSAKEAAKNMASLLKKHGWIEKEKAFFGMAGSDFDFEARDVQTCQERLVTLKASQTSLEKKLNKKVMGMIEKAESEYDDLNKKRQVILNDKQKIEAVIEELDVKKAQALQTTWIRVNRDFGSIFSMLLPGTHAKLEPPEGCTVMAGLEVKVAFNGVWKESLTELSGGQRSLLALSLILALLLFKPAPMYILDEVDAALDLSHTQNIGLMLRTHFSASQFIVVSLKEGMFNNANVIFRTRFVDGVSAVTRTVVGGKNRNNQHAIQNQVEDDEEEVAPKKKGKVSSRAAKGSENAAVLA